jgi:hypothetical protein
MYRLLRLYLQTKYHKELLKYNHECHRFSHSDVFFQALQNKNPASVYNTKTAERLMSVDTMLYQDMHGVGQCTPCHSMHNDRAVLSVVKL